MKIPSTLLLLAVLTFSLSAPAAPPSDKSINQLLQLTKVDQQADFVFTQMEDAMRAGIQRAAKGKTLNAEERAILDRQQAKMAGIMKEELSWEKMKDQYVQVYRETFSQEEIDGLIAFFQNAGRPVVCEQAAGLDEAHHDHYAATHGAPEAEASKNIGGDQRGIEKG